MLPFNLMNPFMITFFTLIFLLVILNSWTILKKTKFKNKKSQSFNLKTLKKVLSIFISFDPKTSFSFFGIKELNWLTSLIILLFMFSSFWIIPSRIQILKNFFIVNLNKQFSIALKSNKDGSGIFFSSIFCLILSCNFFGLFPNIFTPSSHIIFNMFFSIPLWTGFILYGWMNFTKKMLAHLVPLSTPIPLISFMVLIESISNLIRPGTLSIRLMANMVSGHLLLTLMGNCMNLKPLLLIIILVFLQSSLTLLEIAVSFIQAYVFCMLLTLYSDESDF